MSEKQPPKTIYLQWLTYNEDEWYGPTWCEDKINDDDVEYVRRTPKTAAAPDLYRELSRAIDVHRREQFITCPETCWCWDAEAAIAKAEGESS